MTTIFFLINSLENSGGTERVSTLLANNLQKKCNVRIIFCSLLDYDLSYFPIEKNIQIFRLGREKDRYKKVNYLKYVFRLRKLIKKYKPSYIIDVCSAMSLISISATMGRNTKVITWEHFNVSVKWGIFSELARFLAARLSYKIITLTERDSEMYAKNYGAKNVQTIPNPITLETIEYTTLQHKTIIAIGRLAYQKGFDLLLQTWHKCKCRQEGWSLKIIGNGEEKENLLRMIENLKLSDTVQLLPATKKISTEYQKASMYVMSSRFEGLPLVLIEAMSSGLPIVSFDCPTGPREIITPDRTGFLVKNGDIQELAEKIDVLANSESLMKYFSESAKADSYKFYFPNFFCKWLEVLNLC